ncbi:Zinc finger HIT domain-containing protein 1 [Actinomortierella wolfii]|nr:Zinc finger HIT domain-containing protein 1 [Actinomortierella wolfii]
MSKKHERVKAPPKVLDKEARARQVRHHLESLERDNFVALNEFEAIIATAAAAAAAPGPGSLTATNVNFGMLPSSAVGSIVGTVVGTVGPGAMVPMTPTSSSTSLSGGAGGGSGSSGGGVSTSSGRVSKKQKTQAGATAGAAAIAGSGASSGAQAGISQTGGANATRRVALGRKPLNVLIDESGLLQQDPSIPSYVTAAMGPSQYPERHFCSVCGWRGTYRCFRCGMRYCDLRCQKTHEETR